MDEFVPHDFDVPRRLEAAQFVLEPLGPEHDDQDYDASTSSLEHIPRDAGVGGQQLAAGSRTRCSIRRAAT